MFRKIFSVIFLIKEFLLFKVSDFFLFILLLFLFERKKSETLKQK